LEPEPLEKKTGSGAAWDKNQEPEPEPREKKSGARAGAGKKFSGSPALKRTVIDKRQIQIPPQ
jgi:hypothetical protein